MKKATVLIVEDDHNLMLGIRDILELQDYNVLIAANGLDGLKAMNSCPTAPDLIISDIMMPVMNGYEFFETVRNKPSWMTIPFIFLTAKGEKSDVRAGISMGADAYMIKPFDAEDLIVAVDAKLRRSRDLEGIRTTHVSDIKRKILTILNHEFRTPLTFVVAYADMLNRDADELSEADIKMFLHGVNDGADRLRRLIENFILLIDLETGDAEQTYAWRKCRLDNYKELITNAVQRAQATVQDKTAQIKIDVPDAPLPAIIGDSEYLGGALTRLVENAIKFNDQPGNVVNVSAFADKGMLCFRVTDQGRGIPPDELPYIFDTFYQIDRETYEDQGVGVGLPIVKRIAELHRGGVDVCTTPGAGSEFVIRIPVIDN